MSTPSNQQLSHSVSVFFHRYSFVIFVLIVGLSVAGVVYGLSVVVQSAYDTSNQEPQPAPTFDVATIKALDDLQPASSANPPLNLPAGRTNPFSE